MSTTTTGLTTRTLAVVGTTIGAAVGGASIILGRNYLFENKKAKAIDELTSNLFPQFVGGSESVLPRILEHLTELIESHKLFTSRLEALQYFKLSTDAENIFLISSRNGWVSSFNSIFKWIPDRADQIKLFNSKNVHGCNALHLATFEGKEEFITETLLPKIIEFQIMKFLCSEKTYDSGWFPFHLAVSKGHLNLVALYLEENKENIKEISPSILDRFNHSSFMIACCNGHFDVFNLFRKRFPDYVRFAIYENNQQAKSVLHFVCGNGHYEIAKKLLKIHKENLTLLAQPQEEGSSSTPSISTELKRQIRSYLASTDYQGNSPMHLIALSANVPVYKKILKLFGKDQLCIKTTNTFGENPLFLLCKLSNSSKHLKLLKLILKTFNQAEIASAILEHTNKFGKNPIHEICRLSHHKTLKVIFDFFSESDEGQVNLKKIFDAKDNDGMTVLHDSISSYKTLLKKIKIKEFETIQIKKVLKVLRLLLNTKIDPNLTDFSDSTPLYLLCFVPTHEIAIEIVKILLEFGADPTLQHLYGWNCIHAINYSVENCGYESEISGKNIKEICLKMKELMLEKINEKYGESWLDSFDPKKERDFSKIKQWKALVGASGKIPASEKNKILGENKDLQSLCEYIKTKITEKINASVLVDENEEDDETKRNFNIILMCGAGISVAAGIPDFRSRETGIYSNSETASLFSLQTVAQQPKRFWKFVHDSNMNEKLPTTTHKFIKFLQEKGILLRCFTQNIDGLEGRAGVDNEKILQAHGSFNTFQCLNYECRYEIESEEDVEDVWKQIKENEDSIPKCKKCSSLIRPNVTFFGEPLPSEFGVRCNADLPKCDLLIVMGTTLIVYPFAGMVNEVPVTTPRILFNREPTGPFKDLDDELNYRDVYVEGDCDDGVKQFLQHMGWAEEFEKMIS